MSAVTARGALWPVQLARAAPALAIGLVITFSADHSATFGLLVFSAFALTSAAALVWGALRIDLRIVRGVSFVQAAVAAVSGAAALVLVTAGAGTLFLLIIVFGAVTGIAELYLGIRMRGVHQAARDWVAVGILSALLALAVLLVPADYAAPWAASETTASGTLTAQIIVVGILGAYAILVGVYLAIGGLSSRWATAADDSSTEPLTGQ